MNKIYVAGPITKGDRDLNHRAAILVANELLDKGWCPFVPHLARDLNLFKPRTWGFWMEYCMGWLESCDALFRLPGESIGADQEVRVATALHIPVFYQLDRTPSAEEFKGAVIS